MLREHVASTSDEVLFSAYCERRDFDALSQLFHRRAPELLRLAMLWSGGRDDAEDLVQATFLTAITDSSAFARERRVMPWLCGILANRARHARRQARRVPPPARDVVDDPEAAALRAELRAVLDHGIESLPSPYREVLDLHLRQELDHAEISARLQRAPATVRKQLSRGLEQLRRALPLGIASAACVRLAPAQVAATALERARAAMPAPGTTSALRAGLWAAPFAAAMLGWLHWGGAHAAAETDASAPATDATTLASASHPRSAAPGLAHDASRTALAAGLRARAVWRDGTPAVGALLRAVACGPGPVSERELGGATAIATVDATGEARFAPIDAPRFVVGAIELPLLREVGLADAPLTLTLDAPTRVRGRVVDAADQPIAGAEIVACSTSARHECGVTVAVTDAEGRFTWTSSVRQPELFARARGKAPSQVLRANANASNSAELELRLATPSRTLTVKVATADGTPLAAYAAFMPRQSQRRPAQHACADQTGRAEFTDADVEAGTLVVRHPGFAPEVLPVAAGFAPCTLQVHLARGARVSGQIDLAGDRAGIKVCVKPARDATAEPIGALTQQWAYTDEYGRFTIDDAMLGAVTLGALRLSQPTHLDRSEPPLLLAAQSLWLRAGEERVVALRATPPRVVHGRLLAADCEPLAGWLVTATPANLADAALARLRTRSAVTAADGSFHVEGLPRQASVRLACFRPGLRDNDEACFATAEREISSDSNTIDWQLDHPRASCTLRGGVQPPTATVTLLQPGTRRRAQLAVAAEGTFAANELPPGAYVVQIEHPEFGSRQLDIALSATAPRLDLRTLALEPPGFLTCTLASRARVQARLEARGRVIARGQGEASLALGPVAPGDYRLVVVGPDVGVQSRDVRIAAGQQSIAIAAERAARCTLRFPFAAHDNVFETVSSLGLTLRRDGAADALLRHTIAAQPDGSFSASLWLAPGDYTVEAASIWGATATRRFAVGADDECVTVEAPLRVDF